MRSNRSIQKAFVFLALFGATATAHVLACDSSLCYERQRLPFNDSLPRHNLNIDAGSVENENVLHPGDRINDKIGKNLFLSARVSTAVCFVGEPLTVTYTLYSRLHAKSSIVGQPVLTGFNKYDIVNVPDLNPSIEHIGGKAFQVYVLRKTQLVPMIAGKLEIDAMEVSHEIKFVKSDSDSVPTASQLTDFLHQKKKEEAALTTLAVTNTRSSPLHITVKDTPGENRPPGYTGAVGSFTIKTALLAQPTVTATTRRLALEIKGTGSLLLAEPPGISLPEDIEILSMKPIPGSHKTGPNASTSRSFEYVLHFARPGVFKIPPIHFSYFDPVKQVYQIKHSMPIFTEILANPEQINRKAARTDPGRSVKKNNSDYDSQRKSTLLVFVIALAAGVVLFWKKVINIPHGISAWLKQHQRKRPEQQADTPGARAAEKLAVVRNIDANDLRTYYFELNRILWSVITEKVNLAPTDLSKGNIFRELNKQGWTPEEIWELELTMNEYERNLYVPGYRDENDFDLAYNKAIGIISKLERLG